MSIEVNWPESDVTCDRVTYRGRSKKTGREITLQGITVHTFCADGKTPCRFVGYQFRSAAASYMVTADGELIVGNREVVIVDEHGTIE